MYYNESLYRAGVISMEEYEKMLQKIERNGKLKENDTTKRRWVRNTMDIHEIRQLLKMKSIYDIPLSVTYYARVSSESDEQLNSLSNQIQYYEELIRKNPAWTFVDGYIDEGLSGISTKKRENFNRMIEDAKNGKFDFIITKEISRFARNTLDSIQYTRQLLNAGVGVFFQNDNINTLDEDSELRLSIMSSIAQDELRKLSSRIKFGHQQAIKQNVVLGNNRIFGYKKKDPSVSISNCFLDKLASPLYNLFVEYHSNSLFLVDSIQEDCIICNTPYEKLYGIEITSSENIQKYIQIEKIKELVRDSKESDDGFFYYVLFKQE